ASSGTVMGSRYLALVCMHMLPAVVLSVIPTINCIRAGIAGADLDYLAWLKYDLGWLLPMVMAVISVGILCTELTETALAVLIQTAWWFISLITGGTSMYGGNYGWNLIPRHNTELSSAGGDTALCAGVPAGAGPGSVGCDKGSVHEDYHSLSYQDPDQFCFLVASHPAVPVGDESRKL